MTLGCLDCSLGKADSVFYLRLVPMCNCVVVLRTYISGFLRDQALHALSIIYVSKEHCCLNDEVNTADGVKQQESCLLWSRARPTVR